MLKFFTAKKDILAIMSEKKDCSMKLLTDNVNSENRDRFFIANGIDKKNIIIAGLAHSNKVKTVSKKYTQTIVKGVDALVTRDKLFLAVTVADCVPIYFYDEKNKIIGLAHAGWRGIVSNIVKNTLDKMIKIGGNIGDIEIVLGPGIRKCHFEIKEDIADKFKEYPQFVISKKDKIFVDLFGIIKKQLLDLGIKEKNISDSGECTYENKEKYFSYRRDKSEVVEAMMAVIGLK